MGLCRCDFVNLVENIRFDSASLGAELRYCRFPSKSNLCVGSATIIIVVFFSLKNMSILRPLRWLKYFLTIFVFSLSSGNALGKILIFKNTFFVCSRDIALTRYVIVL